MLRRIGFRFGFVFAVLVIYPWPLRYIHGTESLAATLHEPVRWGVNALAALLGLPEPALRPTGSGDTLFAHLELLLFAIVALATTIAWTIARPHGTHDRLARGLRIVLRYWLASSLIIYGLVKLWELQFRTPASWILDQRVGDKSPMGLLWLFMGFSRPYTIFVGIMEVVGPLLLIVRRTATLGALLCTVVLGNVVVMNFCYDVPVKLYSLELLAAAFAIAGPDLRRIIGATLGHAVREVVPAPRMSPMLERLRMVAKLGFLASLGALTLEVAAIRLPPPTELDGTWDVETFTTTGNDTRWSRFLVDDGVVAIRRTTDARQFFRARVMPNERLIMLETLGGLSGVLHYELRDPDHLVIDGSIRDTWYEVTLVRAPPWLLTTRGFHWIQEDPFHR